MLNPFVPRISQAEIDDFCERYGIRKLALFGSILTENFDDRSDIDVLVEYLPEKQITYFDMVRQETQLTAMMGRKVDLRTPMELSRHFRKSVLDTAQVIYDRAG